MIKKMHGEADMASRDVISLVAQQWAACTPEERQMWQYRAEQHEMKPSSAGDTHAVGSTFEEELPSRAVPVEDDGGGKKRARKQPTRGVSAVAATASHYSVSV